MTSTGKDEQSWFSPFVEFIKTWLLNFDINSELFAEIMEDRELPLAVRVLAIGILVYVTETRDMIPEKLKALKLITLLDDILVMAIGLSIIVPLMPESRLKYYREKYDAVAKIEEYEELLKSLLGMLWDRLVGFVERLRQRKYKKKTTEEVAGSPDLQDVLFDETMIFVANLNLNPATLDQQLKALPPPENVMRLLASGLEREQEPVVEDEQPTGLRRLLAVGRQTNQ